MIFRRNSNSEFKGTGLSILRVVRSMADSIYASFPRY